MNDPPRLRYHANLHSLLSEYVKLIIFYLEQLYYQFADLGEATKQGLILEIYIIARETWILSSGFFFCHTKTINNNDISETDSIVTKLNFRKKKKRKGKTRSYRFLRDQFVNKNWIVAANRLINKLLFLSVERFHRQTHDCSVELNCTMLGDIQIANCTDAPHDVPSPTSKKTRKIQASSSRWWKLTRTV